MNLNTGKGCNKYENLLQTGNIWRIDGIANEIDINAVGNNNLYAPSCWYENGRTYLTTRKQHNTTPANAGIIEYFNGGYSLEFMSAPPAGTPDRHNHPVLFSDTEGIFTIMYPRHYPHDDPTMYSEIWKMQTAYDITSFTQQPDTPLIGDYPKIYTIAKNNHFVVGRVDPLNVGFNVGHLLITSYDGANWGTPIQLTGMPFVDGTERHYISYFLNANNSNGKFYLSVTKRNGSGENLLYSENYLMYTTADDIYRWHNLEGTFSKKVDIDGYITEAELSSNFMYSKNTILSGTIPMGFVNKDIVTSSIPIDKINELYIFNGFSWNPPLIRPFHFTAFAVSDELNVVFINNNNQLHSYSTLDWQNYNKRQYFISENIKNIRFNTVVPHNYKDIPIGQKFAIFTSTYKNQNADQINGTENNDIIIIEMIR